MATSDPPPSTPIDAAELVSSDGERADPTSPLDRLWGYAVSVFLLGAVLYPLQTKPPRDSFPLSTYPMFSKARPAFISVGHVMAVGKDGREEPIPPNIVGGGEVLQAKVAIRNTIRRGRNAVRELCRKVAVGVAGDDDWSWVTAIEVRTDRYQVAGYFSGGHKPVSSRLHTRCDRDGKPLRWGSPPERPPPRKPSRRKRPRGSKRQHPAPPMSASASTSAVPSGTTRPDEKGSP